MLTCVLGLTACGAEDEISSHQQNKIDTAVSVAAAVVDTTVAMVEQVDVDALLNDYNNMELVALYQYNFYTNTNTSIEIAPKATYSALSSFSEGLETLGAIVEVGEPTAEVDGDEIIVLVPITGENAKGSVELLFSNDIFFEVSACTLNIEESFGDIIGRAALNTLIGMGMVFVVLIIIIFVISLLGLVPKLMDKTSKKEEPVVAPVETAPVVEEEELADDMELVAVIAAAIAAYEGTSADGFQVRSIKRANTSKWKRA